MDRLYPWLQTPASRRKRRRPHPPIGVKIRNAVSPTREQRPVFAGEGSFRAVRASFRWWRQAMRRGPVSPCAAPIDSCENATRRYACSRCGRS